MPTASREDADADIHPMEYRTSTANVTSVRVAILSSMSTNNPPRVLKLFSWILDVSDRSFFVSIEDGQTVAEPKEEIVKKKPNAFANVDPDQLDIWKVRHFSNLEKLMFITPQGIHRDQPDSYE